MVMMLEITRPLRPIDWHVCVSMLRVTKLAQRVSSLCVLSLTLYSFLFLLYPFSFYLLFVEHHLREFPSLMNFSFSFFLQYFFSPFCPFRILPIPFASFSLSIPLYSILLSFLFLSSFFLPFLQRTRWNRPQRVSVAPKRPGCGTRETQRGTAWHSVAPWRYNFHLLSCTQALYEEVCRHFLATVSPDATVREER